MTKTTQVNKISIQRSVNRKFLNRTLIFTRLKITLVMLAIFTAGCTSTDNSINYYSLNAINVKPNSPTSINNRDSKTSIILNEIIMADFLNTGGLVMQVDTHQIQISNQHRWGNKLSKAISIHLMTSLSQNNAVYIEHNNTSNNASKSKKLTLSFEQFTIAHQQHETVISGYYLMELPEHSERKKAFFDIRQPLSQDGYNHAVENFKQSLDELATLILSDISS